jgi:hypothetical protein
MTLFASYVEFIQTPTHLCKDCPFSKQVWSYLKQWLHLTVLDSVEMNGLDCFAVTGVNDDAQSSTEDKGEG